MITIKAKIDIGSEGSFNYLTSELLPKDGYSNVSSNLYTVLGRKEPVKLIDNAFILGKSILGQGVYVNELPYIMGRYLSDNNGNFTTPYIIKINTTTDTTALTLLFDEENGAHPNSINYEYINNEGVIKFATAYDDDARIELAFAEPTKSVEITINNWNKPNSPFILMGAYAIGDFEINNDNLISFDSDILEKSDVQLPDYGLVSNSANLTFVDFNREIFELITKRIIAPKKEVSIWVDNTDEEIDEQICTMQIQSLTYNNDNLQVSMQLKDNLEQMQTIPVEAIYYDPSNGEPHTAEWYYNYLYQKTIANGYNILSFYYLDSETKNVLANTVIQYPLLESDMLWNEWAKLCELCLCRMYIDNTNTVVLKYNSGS